MILKLRIFITCILGFCYLVDASILSTFATPVRAEVKDRFQSFKEKYRRRYKDHSEELYRKLLMSQNQKKVQLKNQRGNGRFKMEINNFGDLSEDEFRATFANLFVSDKIVEQYAELQAEEAKVQEEDCFCKTENLYKEMELMEKSNQRKIHVRNRTIEEREFRTHCRKNAAQQEFFVKEKIAQTNGQIDYKLLETDLQTMMNENRRVVKQKIRSQVRNSMEAPYNNTRMLQEKATDLATYNIDWTKCSGEVREQGQCGACYALTAVQNLESIIAIYAFGFNIQLSVQQIIDCGKNQLSFGCQGGFLEGPFTFLLNHGITTEYEYPYISGTNGGVKNACKNTNSFFKIKSYSKITKGDCKALRTALQSKPVSVGIASLELQFYLSGTFNDCGTTIDHAVLLIGYNNVKGWKIKNSWGTAWGEGGYAWIADGNSCGICENAMTPSISSEGEINKNCSPRELS